jgi:hypothetical protein
MGGCMNYKIIKTWPGCIKKVGDTISPYDLYRNIVKDWPEYFEEVKEKIFTSEDGVDIYMGDVFFSLDKNNLNLRVLEHRNYSKINKKQAYKLGYLYFSTKEAAEKYIDENKPMYSKKQVLNALLYSNPFSPSKHYVEAVKKTLNF